MDGAQIPAYAARLAKTFRVTGTTGPKGAALQAAASGMRKWPTACHRFVHPFFRIRSLPHVSLKRCVVVVCGEGGRSSTFAVRLPFSWLAGGTSRVVYLIGVRCAGVRV